MRRLFQVYPCLGFLASRIQVNSRWVARPWRQGGRVARRQEVAPSASASLVTDASQDLRAAVTASPAITPSSTDPLPVAEITEPAYHERTLNCVIIVDR